MPRRIFSPEDANRTLPLVRRIVSDIVSTHREIQRLHEEYHQRSTRLPERASLSRPDREALESRVQSWVDQLHDYRRELAKIGCIVKDEEKGLIDYPGKIEGRDVWLCWLLGEDAVGYFHDLDAGFSGRQPLPKTAGTVSPPSTNGEPALDQRSQ